MTSTLLTLPNDILMDILDPLSQKDLRNLALLSSRFTDPAQEPLFRSIWFHLPPPNKPDNHEARPGNRRIFIKLVNALSQNPQLWLYASTLSIRVVSTAFYIRLEDHENLINLAPHLRSLFLDPPPVHFQLSNIPLPFLDALRLTFADYIHPSNMLPINERKPHSKS
jgi:hypothetical protein